jgi:RNA ligase
MNLEFDKQLIEDERFFDDVEWEELQDEINAGYINVNKHPDFPLYIYNYSKSAQYEWRWNKYTMMCRGLILDGDGRFIAKGFDKFFTDDQLNDKNMGHLIPTHEPFTITDKVDGSLGVMYFWEDMPYIATRGSFESEMAIEANKWLQGMYGHIVFFPQYTYMFEIIYPENKIVVDYGDERKLVLLAVLDNATMKEVDIFDPEFDYIEEQGLERVKRFDGWTDWKEILNEFKDAENVEGFVVHFTKSDFRVKMKLDWYKNLAYIMQYFTKRSIWKMYRDHKDVKKIIEDIDDEFYPLVKAFDDELWAEYDKELERCRKLYHEHIAYMNSNFSTYTKGDYVRELHKRVPTWEFHMVMTITNGKTPFKQIWYRIEPKGSPLED